MKLVKGGPFVSARIEQDDEGRWIATINGEAQFPANADPILAGGILKIWHSAQVIDEAEYTYLLELKWWAENSNPDHPAANPMKAIDLLTSPLVY